MFASEDTPHHIFLKHDIRQLYQKIMIKKTEKSIIYYKLSDNEQNKSEI